MSTGVEWIDAVLMIVGGTIIGLCLAILALIFFFAIIVSIGDRVRDYKNRKKGNLHITVDSTWKNKMK